LLSVCFFIILTAENETNDDFIPPSLTDRVYMIYRAYEEFKSEIGLGWDKYVNIIVYTTGACY
jgi:hypothetical protein